jgi:tetratricopeptide (TPR) repeat protein
MALLHIRKLFLLTICVFMIQLLQGQTNNKTDSLIRVLRVTHDNKAKARLLLDISKEQELRDPEEALRYARQARQIAQISDFDSAEVRAMISMGMNYNRVKQLKDAIKIGEQVVEKASRWNMSLEIAEGRGIMAVAYAQVGDFDNSSKLYFENLKLYEKLNKKDLTGRTLGNIGADFLEQQNYIKALEYTKKALQIGLETNNLALVTDQYNNLAAIYHIGFSDYATAMLNYYKALEVAEEIQDFEQQGGIMLNISNIFMLKNNFDSALFYLDRSCSVFQKLNNPILMAEVYIAFANFYFQKGDYLKSREFALSSLKIGEENGALQTILNTSDLMYKICLLENDSSEAFKYHLILANTKDSLFFLQNQKELFKLEFQYNQDKLVKEQKIRQLRNYFILGFIILGLLSGLAIILLFYSRQKIKIKNTTLEKEKAVSDLKFKNKELSINLMALLKKNNLIAEISQKLANLENSPPGMNLKESLIRLNHEIKQSTDDRLWQEFSVQFKETNSEFYNKLLKKYSDLTHSELKLCAYLRLNMTTKEIADLTGQTTETLGKARYRLRKKFGLTNSEGNLVTFLTQI